MPMSDKDEVLQEECVRLLDTFAEFKVDGVKVPLKFQQPLVNYIVLHKAPNSFLLSCFSNDLFGATRYTTVNISQLKSIMKWIYMETPSICWGSISVVFNWINEND